MNKETKKDEGVRVDSLDDYTANFHVVEDLKTLADVKSYFDEVGEYGSLWYARKKGDPVEYTRVFKEAPPKKRSEEEMMDNILKVLKGYPAGVAKSTLSVITGIHYYLLNKLIAELVVLGKVYENKFSQYTYIRLKEKITND